MVTSIKCLTCGKTKSESEFYPRYKTCKVCLRARVKARRAERRAEPGGIERENALIRSRRAEYKRKAIEGYGGCCSCCGENRLVFLCLDHVDGGGVQEHRSIKGNSSSILYKRVVAQGFPPEYRVLCWNCNYAITRGVCPHQEGEG